MMGKCGAGGRTCSFVGYSAYRYPVKIRRCSAVAASPQERDEQTAQFALLEGIGQQLGIMKLADWYKVTRPQVVKKGGRQLFKGNSSLDSILKEHYPHYQWKSDNFVRERGDSWRKKANQRKFLSDISPQLGIKEMSDWYSVTRKQVTELGGAGLFLYHPSLKDALESLYPEYPWEAHRFVGQGKRAPRGYWKSQHNLMAELQRVETHMGITQPEDWYSVNVADMREIGFPNIRRSKLIEMLGVKYPNHSWEPLRLLRGRLAQQKQLERMLVQLFPGIEKHVNSRKEAGLINPTTRDYLELDIFFPSLNLAFEFQERHHYMTQGNVYTTLASVQKKDWTKRELAKEKGIALITVPFWWDGKQESLVATIRKGRPDLLVGISDDQQLPIPEDMPDGLTASRDTVQVKGIGIPTTASFFTLSKIDPTKWWMFEKYDGIRGFWNPQEKAFYSRLGRKFTFPQHVIDSMPTDLFLDGELWFGRDNFQESMKIVHRASAAQTDWSKFKFMVFDVPNYPGTYEERYKHLVSQLLANGGGGKYVMIAEKQECKDMNHLEQFFQDVIDIGGEGVILRDPEAPYLPGRSPGYLKHKKYRDAEARVVRQVSPVQWECELPDGVKFEAAAATTVFIKKWKLREGDIVSFKHHGFLLNSGRPKFPTLYRIREDLTWESVVDNWKEHRVIPSVEPLYRPRSMHKPKGYWSDRENQRKYFLEYAQHMKFDPFDHSNWLSVSREHVTATKGPGPLQKNKLQDALELAFPEMQFTTKRQQNQDWSNTASCREFFMAFAKEKGFDPLAPAGWYSVNLQQLLSKRGGFAIRRRYSGFRGALQACFPELSFDQWATRPTPYQRETLLPKLE